MPLPPNGDICVINIISYSPEFGWQYQEVNGVLPDELWMREHFTISSPELLFFTRTGYTLWFMDKKSKETMRWVKSD